MDSAAPTVTEWRYGDKVTFARKTTGLTYRGKISTLHKTCATVLGHCIEEPSPTLVFKLVKFDDLQEDAD